jgi:hypothetical protein
MIPIFCANGMSAQGAVDEAIVQLRASKDRFDVAANALRSDAKEDPIKYKHVPEWIDACQSLCTGNVHWRYVASAYPRNRTNEEIVLRQGDMVSKRVPYQAMEASCSHYKTCRRNGKDSSIG